MENIVIEIDNLRKNYSENEVLRGINFSVKQGEVIGYLGSNGAGKTTTVKILCGLIHEFTGRVSILGHDLRKDESKIKYRIGYVPENAEMYEQLTPLEYLELVGTLYNLTPDIIREKSGSYLEMFDMVKEQNERMFSFSKGMKQKIHIISGLLHDPDILFLDEPLNGLDANAVIIVKNIIAKFASEGKAVFYCSHLMDIVEKVSSRILLLNKGSIIADGTFDELKELHQTNSLETIFTKLTKERQEPRDKNQESRVN